MKKTTIFLTCILCSAFVFSNGINKSPAETLIPDDAQLTFSPNSWEKTSYDKALVDFEFNDSLFSLSFAYKFKTMRIG